MRFRQPRSTHPDPGLAKRTQEGCSGGSHLPAGIRVRATGGAQGRPGSEKSICNKPYLTFELSVQSSIRDTEAREQWVAGQVSGESS